MNMTEYKLIPMSEITDEARELAVLWSENMKDDFISQKHKLASDIMNYAESLAKERAVDGFNLISELRTRLLVDQNQDGEPNSSMTELLDMWDRVHAYMDTFLAEKRKEGAK